MRRLIPILFAAGCHFDVERCLTPYLNRTLLTGDIDICPGEYTGKTFVVEDDAFVTGENVTLKGRRSQEYPIIEIRGSKVGISGLNIGGYFGGIRLVGSGESVTIEGNNIQSEGRILEPGRPADYCVLSTGHRNLAVLDNIIGNCHTGIFVKGSGRISHNQIGPNYIGVHLDGDILFEHNILRGNNEAMKTSEDVETKYNTIEDF